MNNAGHSLLLRLARWQVRALVRVWPEETRRWGQALAAEAEEIEQPLQAFHWALGGVAVYLRGMGTYLVSWLRLPVGKRPGASPENLTQDPEPKRSRLFTAAVLTGAAILLCVPEGREAVRTVAATWGEFAQKDLDHKELLKLGDHAEKENDARVMAFVALSLREGNRKAQLSDRAAAQDSQLTWIYAVQGRGDDVFPPKPEWLAKLQAADPDNAVPYLLAADVIARRYASVPGGRYSVRNDKEFDTELHHDAEWIALMHRGFRAPHYNSYYREHEELNREIWRREPQLSFVSAFGGLWGHPIPNLLQLRKFSDFLTEQAKDERLAGHEEQAETLLREVGDFGTRLEQQSSTRIETLIGFAIQTEAARVQKSFYEGAGKSASEQAAAQRLTDVEQRSRAVIEEDQRLFRSNLSGRTNAWVVQINGILLLSAALAAIASIVLLEARPAIWKSKPISRQALRWVADLAPSAVLLFCAVFLAGFLPYERLFTAFRAGGTGAPNEEQVMGALWGLLGVTWTIGGADFAVLSWTALIVVLSVLAALLLARMAYRAWRRPTAA